jgi:predicted transcriptional regulator
MSDERQAVGPERVLGELEAAIMQIVWRQGEATVRDVWSELTQTRALAYTTVMTVMRRLVPKGVLTIRKAGQSYVYRALVTPEQLMARRAEEAVQHVLADYGEYALAEFVRELEQVDPARLAALRRLVQQDDADAD